MCLNKTINFFKLKLFVGINICEFDDLYPCGFNSTESCSVRM